MIRPTIKTAPGVTPYAEIDLIDKATCHWAPPIDNDIKTTNFKGHLTRSTRSIQRVIVFDCLGLTADDAQQLESWEKNRVRVRPFANYGRHTTFYSCFQRADEYTYNALRNQIGPDPSAWTETVLTGSADICRLDDNGKFYKVAASTPRFTAGPFGMHGIVSDMRFYQYWERSHPSAGYPLWSAKSGSPTVTLVQDLDSIVDGETYLCFANMATSAVIRQVSPVGIINDVGPHSFCVWVKGVGQFFPRVLNATTQAVIANGALVTMDGSQWARLSIEDFTKPAGVNYDFEIWCISALGGMIFLGPQMLSDTQYNSDLYFHNMSLLTVRKAMGTCEWASPYRNPDLAGSVYWAFKWPHVNLSNNANQWWFHQENTSPNRFGAMYQGSANRILFQKNSASISHDSPVAPPTDDDGDCIAAATYDLSAIKLFLNGALVGTNSSPGREIVKDGLNLGDPEINTNGMTKPLAFLRIDAECHSESTVINNLNAYVDDEQRVWMTACEGRDFEIRGMALDTVEGNPDQFKGQVALVEVYSHYTQTIEEP